MARSGIGVDLSTCYCKYCESDGFPQPDPCGLHKRDRESAGTHNDFEELVASRFHHFSQGSIIDSTTNLVIRDQPVKMPVRDTLYRFFRRVR